MWFKKYNHFLRTLKSTWAIRIIAEGVCLWCVRYTSIWEISRDITYIDHQCYLDKRHYVFYNKFDLSIY